jgi:hypothetical protein
MALNNVLFPIPGIPTGTMAITTFFYIVHYSVHDKGRILSIESLLKSRMLIVYFSFKLQITTDRNVMYRSWIIWLDFIIQNYVSSG